MPMPLSGINAVLPASGAKSITPSDSTSFPFVTKSIYVGTGGNIAVVLVTEGDTAGKVTVFSNVLGGTILPVQATRVNSTSTTASNLVAMY